MGRQLQPGPYRHLQTSTWLVLALICSGNLLLNVLLLQVRHGKPAMGSALPSKCPQTKSLNLHPHKQNLDQTAGS